MFNHEPKNYECIFCNFLKGKKTEYNRKSDIVYEDNKTLAFISPKWWPNNSGAVIVIPKKHYENIYDVPDDELSSVYKTGKKIAIAIRKTYKCDGTSMRQHNESDGNQDVWHFHIHVFPRYKNDQLYQRHDERRYVGSEERKFFAHKIRKYFGLNK